MTKIEIVRYESDHAIIIDEKLVMGLSSDDLVDILKETLEPLTNVDRLSVVTTVFDDNDLEECLGYLDGFR